MKQKELINKGTVHRRNDGYWAGMVSYKNRKGEYCKKNFCGLTKKSVNPLGIALIISVSVFLFFKVLFLIVNIMYKVEYGYDDAERGESGRRVRKSDSDFFFG